MDRSIPQFNRFLAEKWHKEEQNRHEQRLMEIWSNSKVGKASSSIPSQHDAIQSQDRMRRIFQLESRKK